MAPTAPRSAKTARATATRAPGLQTTATATTGADAAGVLKFLHMYDARSGVAVDTRGRVLRTSDGGHTWINVTPAGITSALANTIAPSRYFTDFPASGPSALVASKTGRPVLLTSTDRGATWRVHPLPAAVQQPPNTIGIDFVDATHGYMLLLGGAAMGSEAVTLYRTSDAGASWDEVAAALPPPARPPSGIGTLPFGGDKTGLTFLNPENGWISGVTAASGALWLMRTTDGGRTWRGQRAAIPKALAGAQLMALPPVFLSATAGVLPAQLGQSPPATAFFVTSDGGSSWTYASTVHGSYNETLLTTFLPDGHGWASDGLAFFTTADGGRSWQPLPQTNPDAIRKDLHQLDFISPEVGWALVSFQGGSRLLKTTDGGRTWAAPR